MDRPMLNDGTATRRYADEAAILRNADNVQNTTVKALTESGVSGGALRSNIIAAGLNRGRALNEGYTQAEAINRNVDDRADAIDRETMLRNNAERARVKENYDRDLGAYSSRRSQLASQLGTDVGNIGKEEVYKNMAQSATGYSWDGQYYTNRNGDKLTSKEYHQLKAKEDNKKTSTDNKAVGGYIFRK